MNFFFNGKILYRKITGVERYARETIREIDKIAENMNLYVAIPANYDEHMLSFTNIRVIKVKGISDGILWDQYILPKFAKKRSGVVVSFDFSTSLLWPGISTIHDMSFRRNKDFFNCNWKQKMIRIKLELYCLSAKRSKYPIFTVSNFQKNEIAKLCNIEPTRIVVAENAWQHFRNIEEDDTVFEEFSIKKKNYYFSLSSNTPNKNFRWVYEVAKRNLNDEFVIVGGKTSISLDDLKTVENIKYIGYQSDQRVKSLYKGCKAFLFPSFYEGFGIPPLEAMSVGAPIIISNTSSLPEIYGNSAAYIDPYNSDIRLSKIDLPETDTGKYILEKYNWEVTAQKWVKCLKEVN